MEEFVLLNYNSNEYVLIDSYMYEGKEIFHFASVYDHLLCEKNNDSFSPITDETAEKIKDYLEMMVFQLNLNLIMKIFCGKTNLNDGQKMIYVLLI